MLNCGWGRLGESLRGSGGCVSTADRGSGGASRSGDGPSGGCGVESEDTETREVGCGGEKVEIGVDFGSAPDPGTAAAMSSAHEMTDFAFDFGSGRPVVGSPVGVVLEPSGVGEAMFVASDTDTPAAL